MNHETNPFLAGMQAKTTTTNGAQAFSTTLNSCLDFFAKAPMAETTDELYDLLTAAWAENPELTTQLAFWLRDPRQGAGRREAGRKAFHYIALRTSTISDPANIAQYGRWDDLLSLPMSDQCIANWIETARKNSLAAKWLPRESSKKKGAHARTFAKTLGMTPKEYRKFCSKHTRVVETQMCQRNWNEIEYSHVPSQAFRKLQAAFKRNDCQRFNEFIESANRGEVKVNAGAIYPHETILRTIEANSGGWSPGKTYPAEEAQWKSLPSFFDGPCSTIVVADTSGSMFTRTNSVRPIDVSLALALYCAERMQGPFKDNFITFSEKASLHYVDPNKSVAERISGIQEIVSNTDLMSVYNLILSTAKTLRVEQKDMPKNILIVSDLQFDSMVDASVPHQKAKEMFEEAGYQAPNLIYWNVANAKALPITHNEAGAALVSGYSPSVLKAVLYGDLNPMSVMRRAIEQYPTSLQ